MSNETMKVNSLNGSSPVSETATSAEKLELLLTELGATSLEEALTAVRALKHHASGAPAENNLLAALPAGADAPESLSDPRRVLAKLRAFTTKIDSLNGTISSMENQLKSLYADRERLEQEIGASEVDDVIAAFGLLQTTIRSMENQLMTLYSGRETLEVELGKSDPTEIVAMFRNIAQLVRGVHQELDYTKLKN